MPRNDFKQTHNHLMLVMGLVVSASALVNQTCNGQVQPQKPSVLKKTATNLTKFGIPFSISDPDNRYIEVQLYFSKDLGQSWQFFGRQSTSATEFPFETTGEGTYWFSLRTLDRDRKIHPTGRMAPELEVVVDSIDPELEFRVQTDAAGRLVCNWRAQDEHIDPSSIALSLRPLIEINDESNVWIPVPYRPLTEANNGVFADQYAWWPESPAREVLVRFQISDTAGNRTTEERQIVVPVTAKRTNSTAMVAHGTEAVGQATLESVGKNSNESPPHTRTEAFKPDPAAPNPNISALPKSPTKPDMAWKSDRTFDDGQRAKQNTSWPIDLHQKPTLEVSPQSPQIELDSTKPQPPVRDALHPITKSMDSRTSTPDSIPNPPNDGITRQLSDGAASLHPAGFVQRGPNRLQQDEIKPTHSSQELQSVVEMKYDRPPLGKYDSISTRRFRIGYSLDRLSPNEIEKVVLWMTSDGGESWTSYGEDPDNTSPFPVELELAGVYGFRVVFHTKDGLAGRPPTGGEPADYWIRLDLVAPQGQLMAAPYGRGDQVGSLIIQWKASDELMAERPITLFYSTEQSGPWTTIVAAYENSGSYSWKVGTDVPEKVYLRLQADDAAGNQTFSQTNQPVDLSGLIPKARITGVEPVR